MQTNNSNDALRTSVHPMALWPCFDNAIDHPLQKIIRMRILTALAQMGRLDAYDQGSVALSLSCRRQERPDHRLPAHRPLRRAVRSAFFRKAVRLHGLPDKVTIDQSGVNKAAIEALQEETGHRIEIRQSKYLNNLVEQDHRAIKRIIRSMLGLKSFRSAQITLQGIELMHMIKKGQMTSDNNQNLSAAGKFYSLAA
jgi:hypothetical protein